jgi:hypothetical protein
MMATTSIINADLHIPAIGSVIRDTLTERVAAWCKAMIVEQGGSYTAHEIAEHAAPDARRETVRMILSRLEAEGLIGRTLIAHKPRKLHAYHRKAGASLTLQALEAAEAWRLEQEGQARVWTLGDLAEVTALPRRVAASILDEWERARKVLRDRPSVASQHAVFGSLAAVEQLRAARALAKERAEQARAERAAAKRRRQAPAAAAMPDLRGASVWAWGGR